VYKNPVVRIGTIKWAIIDQMYTLLFIWRLVLEAPPHPSTHTVALAPLTHLSAHTFNSRLC